MINLKTTVRDKDTMMTIYKDGKKIKRKALGYRKFKSVEGIPAGTYQVVARNVLWTSQPFEFEYDGTTPITLVAIAHPDYNVFKRLTTKYNQYFKIVQE